MAESLNSIASVINENKNAVNSKAIGLNLTEQYIEAMQAIYARSNVLMIPKNDDFSGAKRDPLSIQNIAQAIAVYRNVMGGD